MLETSNILVNKLILPIRKKEGISVERKLISMVKSALFQHICDFFHVNLEWRPFCYGGALGGSGYPVSGVCATCQEDEGTVQWAMTLNVKEPFFSRRRWKYYIGLSQTDAAELKFSYAKCCYDHMAGSISPAKPIIALQDLLIHSLLSSQSLQFMSGTKPYPTEAIELKMNNFQDFIDLVLGNQRTIPVLLITCPDIVSPQKLWELMMGNVVIYWSADPELIVQLNNKLPDNMFTPWDSVHVLTPIINSDSFHPIHTFDEIHRMGTDALIAGLRQAYCQSLRSEERKHFPTVESVNYRRNQIYTRMLLKQRDAQQMKILELSKNMSDQANKLQDIRQRLQQYQVDHPEDQIAEYESLLNEALRENDALKEQISALSSRLFGTMGKDFIPNEHPSLPQIKELEHAIFSVLACANERK